MRNEVEADVMSGGPTIGNLSLETLFGLTGVFLLFSPKVLGWSAWSYLAGILFIVLSIVVVMIRRS